MAFGSRKSNGEGRLKAIRKAFAHPSSLFETAKGKGKFRFVFLGCINV